jgi:methyl-accepting chemotaxis protein
VSSELASSQEYKEMWTNLAKGSKIEGELERYTKSGKRVYIKGAYTSIRDLNGRPIRIIKLVTDITATKNLIIEAQQQTMQIVEQENEIRKSLETMQELQRESDKRMVEMNYYLEALNTSMITMEVTTDGQILEANSALLEILKYDADSLKARVHADLMHPEDLQHQQYQQLWVQLKEGQNTQITMRRLTSDNEVRWFRSYYFPKQQEDGTIDKIIELSYDFTLEKIQEDKIINNEKILHERVKSIEDKAYNRIVKLKQEMKTKLAEKDELIASLEKK